MIVLGLDCATKTGYCLIDGNKIIDSGVLDLTKKRGESNGVMFLKFRKWLKQALTLYKVGLVVYEQSHHRGGAATEVGVNLTGRVQEVCADFEVDYMSVHTATLKKATTGSGNASKDEMIAAVKEFTHHVPEDDNEADAIALALYGYKQIN